MLNHCRRFRAHTGIEHIRPTFDFFGRDWLVGGLQHQVLCCDCKPTAVPDHGSFHNSFSEIHPRRQGEQKNRDDPEHNLPAGIFLFSHDPSSPCARGDPRKLGNTIPGRIPGVIRQAKLNLLNLPPAALRPKCAWHASPAVTSYRRRKSARPLSSGNTVRHRCCR